MAIKIQLPRLGWSMEEGKFLEWLRKDGDLVKEGEPLFTLESDKAAQEVEALEGGLLSLCPDSPMPGQIVKVGQVLGYLLTAGEPAPATCTTFVPPAASPGYEEPEARTQISGAGTPAVPTDKPATAAEPAGPDRSVIPATPRARRAARQQNVDLSTLQPTGKGGRIRERDVLGARVAPAPTAGSMREIPVTPMRRTIANRMVNSLNNTAPVTLTCRCDATGLVTLRTQLKAAGATVVPGVTDIVAKVTAGALHAHPMLTARWDTDRLLLPNHIHIGIAVDTEAGLLVPVLRDVHTSALTAIATQSRQLFETARAGRLGSADMQGGCFTITNLGGFGIEGFTPIINHPETAILGLGAILYEPVVLADGTLTRRRQMTLSLTFDHRILDGAPAARFLQTLRQRIEEPVAWII
jgi:pyruvate dehydrogenase E2 component (dihydrolipoamide acetyltransferase)